MNEQRHKLIQSGTEHRCILCGKTFKNLTPQEAQQIEEVCSVLRKNTVMGVIRIDSAVVDAMLARLFGVPPSSPVPNADHKEIPQDSAQRKGNALAAQIEEEWGIDE
jgi:hypothetical protein